MTQLDDLLRKTVEMGGSDLLLKVGSPPLVRKGGELVALPQPPLSEADARTLSLADTTPAQQDRFRRDLELDFAYALPGVARFRGNLYFQRGYAQSVFRAIPLEVRTIEDIRLPPVCRYFAERPHGLVLLTGTSGSGKSTTQAALIDYVNRHFTRSIITIEDPIEFVHPIKESVISQREIYQDALSFESALRAAMHQDADIIVVGEMHGPETLALALSAAEMGHLVFGTFDASDAAQTIERYIDIFPLHQQPQIRAQMASNLVGIISQALVRTKDGENRIAAYETLAGVPAVLGLVREGKTSQIPALLKSAMKQGMMTLDQSLANLVNKGLVTYDDALEHARNLTEFHFLCSGEETGQEAVPAGR